MPSTVETKDFNIRFLLKQAASDNDVVTASNIDQFNRLSEINEREFSGSVEIRLVDDQDSPSVDGLDNI